MRRALSRILITLTCGLALTLPVATGTATAGASAASTPPEMGLSFTGDARQCNGPTQQWTPSPDFTIPIRFNTDDRSGGCQLAFGVRDLASNLAGLALSYSWQVSPGGDGGQCGNQATNVPIPITQFLAFGSSIGVDTDGRPGWCDLTFMLSGRTDVSLDVQFWADGDGQCVNALPQGQWYSVRPGVPITVGIDADNRSGGCLMSLRLRQF
jgi:hypothetical protein